MRRLLWAVTSCTLLAVASACGGGDLPARRDYRLVVDRLSQFIEREMSDKELPALSIALVDDQEIVWARGFGYTNLVDSTRATAGTVYRVGSVSKLFTDVAVMQLVERGEIDLDAPVTMYLPTFTPENAFGGTVTLRQLMSHRSGLVREPPVGHYFDDTGPTLAATVESLDSTALVYAPGSRTKYSNAGVAAVGYVLEQLTGQPFPDYLRAAVLDPLGMNRSSFVPTEGTRRKAATGYMWSYHGIPHQAPTFELGMAPAGSMYAPVTDLAWFVTMILSGGVGERDTVLADATLAEMFTPQFAEEGATTGFGIGFAVDELDGHRRVGHGGAIYGFSTELAVLPDQRVGAVAATSMDASNAVVDRIVEYALRLMIARRSDLPLPAPQYTQPVSDELRLAVPGTYRLRDSEFDIVRDGNELYAWINRPGFRVRLRSRGDTLVLDDRLFSGSRVMPIRDGLVLGNDTLRRVLDRRPRAAPRRWRGLIGEYGWDYDVLYVLERGGQLHALIEWFYLYPLREISRDVYAFPDWGLYTGERLVFERDASGQATRVVTAGVPFVRREASAPAGETFRITPVRPVEELREAALAATPPAQPTGLREPDLVDLKSLDATILYDIRYASENNFVGAQFYDTARAMMQRPAAEALARVHQRLRPQGYGLLIHDAYRPWYVTKMFWDATPLDQRMFVANPAQGSRHNRGAAVDLTLYDRRTGRPVAMVGGYDEFSDRSFPRYPGGTSIQRWHRELLRAAMEAEGFTVYRFEWWHFDYGDWREYPVMNGTFEEAMAGAM